MKCLISGVRNLPACPHLVLIVGRRWALSGGSLTFVWQSQREPSANFKFLSTGIVAEGRVIRRGGFAPGLEDASACFANNTRNSEIYRAVAGILRFLANLGRRFSRLPTPWGRAWMRKAKAWWRFADIITWLIV